MKKELFGVLLVPILLAACCVPTATPEEARVPTATPEKIWTYQDMVVGLVQLNGEGGWRVANLASFKETAEELGITLKFYDSANPRSHLKEDFRYFLADEEVNVIVLSALDPTGWEDALREAKTAGKIVILQDLRVDVPEDLYVTRVGFDFVEEGRKAAIEMCKFLEGDEKKYAVEIAGSMGNSAAKDRSRGFHEKMSDCGIEIIEQAPANWTVREGKEVMASWLRETTDIQGVFAQNDDMGLGAIEAIKEAGLRPGIDIKVVSIDATAGAFEAMLAGELNASVECSPLVAPQVYEAALKALNGEELPKWIPVEESVFSSDMPDLQEIADGRRY
jgi:ABC-type sugar transport system substrate-binding protein